MGETPNDVDDQKPALSLSGNVHTKEDVEVLEVDRLAPGDLKVYAQLDEQGRMAVRGGHTNFGYSGYFAASIFDGTKWRRFDLRTVVPEKESGFAAQQDKANALDRIRKRVQPASGRQCVWQVPEGKAQGRYVAAPTQQGSKP